MKGLGIAALSAVALVSVLSGCSGEARSTAIVAPLSAETLLDQNSPLRKSTWVGFVVGGAESTFLTGAQVSNESFRRALESSLDLTTILGEPTSPLVVDAAIESFEQPVITLSFTVTSTISYRVRSTRTGAVVWQDRVVAQHTTKFQESLVRSERFRIANEGSARANIAEFIRRLVAAAEADPNRFR